MTTGKDTDSIVSIVEDKIRTFHKERIKQIMANENIPTPLDDVYNEPKPKLVLHLLPLSAFESRKEYSVSHIADCASKHDAFFRPLGVNSSHFQREINVDGLLHYIYVDEQNRQRMIEQINGYFYTPRAYTQFYHSGIIEAACNLEDLPDHSDGIPIINTEYENWLVNQKYLDVLKVLGVSTPVYLFVSLLNMNGTKLQYHGPKSTFGIERSNKIYNKDEILVPARIIVSFDTSPAAMEGILKPIFDRLINAWGVEKSLHFDVDEKKQPQPA